MAVPTDKDALTLMKSHSHFKDISDEALNAVAERIRIQRYQVGDLIYRANRPVGDVGFLVAGRVKAVMAHADGTESLYRYVERGASLGMISAAMGEPLPISAYAVEPSTLLMLDYDAALDLTAKYKELRKRWSQRLAESVRAQILHDVPADEAAVVTVFHQTPATRRMSAELAKRLPATDEDMAVMSDLPDGPEGLATEMPHRCIFNEGRWVNLVDLHSQIAEWNKPDRLLIDVDVSIEDELKGQIIGLSKYVIWVIKPDEHAKVAEAIKQLVERTPSLADKMVVVWDLEDEYLAPPHPQLRELVHRDFKISNRGPTGKLGGAISAGMGRLIQFLRGQQIGLALGGGAARGMAHMGVLKAFEEQGIFVDRIAGTSAGAMVGILYSAGMNPDYIVDRFTEDLRPSWVFRNMPRGGYWYLLYKYRTGRFDPMLRNYLQDLQLEQLPVPCSSVTVDLVSGQAVIRQTGDATNAILESINLPILSTPIMRDGQALIDGGYVNNVPADILVSQGCNLVIAVDVVAKIETHFGQARNKKSGKVIAPNSVQTVMRSYVVQGYNMKSVGAMPADVRIEPDVSHYDIAEFTKAREMADIGHQATVDKMSDIKRLVDQFARR